MKILSFAALAFGSLFFNPVVAQTGADNAFSELLNTFNTVSGHFTQTQIAESGEILEVTENEISIQRPGLLRLHTLSPYEQIIVTNRETLWEYDPEFQEVIVRPYDARLEQSPAALLSGNIDTIRQNFEVEQITDNLFKLKPLSRDQGIESLELEFSNGLPLKISSFDSLGQTITFEFSNLIINQPIDKKTFEFETPPGVEEVLADG